MPEEKITKIHCNGCGRDTKHLLLADHRQQDYELVGGDEYHPVTVDWTIVYEMFECRGCESVSVRRRTYFSEWGRDEFEEVFYPPRASRRLPGWSQQLPEDCQNLLEEIYAALHADSRRLALMGSRAVLDMFIVKKVGDVGRFDQKLDALQAAGYIGLLHRRLLEAALDAGNAATHRGHAASADELKMVIDIIEHVLQADLLEPGAEALRNSIPPRPSRAFGRTEPSSESEAPDGL